MKLLTAAEVAEQLGVKTDWVLDHARAGEIPSFKLGQAVRFREDEILEWLEKQRRGTIPASRSLKVVGGR